MDTAQTNLSRLERQHARAQDQVSEDRDASDMGSISRGSELVNSTERVIPTKGNNLVRV